MNLFKTRYRVVEHRHYSIAHQRCVSGYIVEYRNLLTFGLWQECDFLDPNITKEAAIRSKRRLEAAEQQDKFIVIDPPAKG